MNAFQRSAKYGLIDGHNCRGMHDDLMKHFLLLLIISRIIRNMADDNVRLVWYTRCLMIDTDYHLNINYDHQSSHRKSKESAHI